MPENLPIQGNPGLQSDQNLPTSEAPTTQELELDKTLEQLMLMTSDFDAESVNLEEEKEEDKLLLPKFLSI